MRFDDSLETVLAAEMAGPAGIQSAWRQLVDLIGRRKGGTPAGAIARLRAIRDDVPVGVRSASARGLERANPPAALVALFADDSVAVAAPVVRSARLSADEWIALLPTMQPATRGVMRHRRDLSERVQAALSSFGPSDFALPAADLNDALIEPPAVEHLREPDAAAEATVMPVVETPNPVVIEPAPQPVPPSIRVEPSEPAAFVAPEPDPFVPVADVVRELPVVVEALRREQDVPFWAVREPAPPAAPGPSAPADAQPAADDFAIAELVARIEKHQRSADVRPQVPVAPPAPADRFRFETDAQGVIRWCDGVERGPVIGLSMAAFGPEPGGAIDGSAGGAFARRACFADARLLVPGNSPAAGAWRMSATPAFDRASGRFTGYRGNARRPRPDEEPRIARATRATDALRQLVHELRTPANAISGFAEMIEREMLGPVPPGYRDQAATIRRQTADLLEAIDDVDTAARLESGGLDLRRETVSMAPLLARVVADLRPLADLRRARLDLIIDDAVTAVGDSVALERLFARLLTAVVASAGEGELVHGVLSRDGDAIGLTLGRPAALTTPDGSLFGGDAETEAAGPGAPLLGTGFAFRLARKLAVELGGTLAVAPDRLTLRLPAAVDGGVEQATV